MNILLRRTLSVTPLRNLPVNKRLRKFGRIQFIAISVCVTNFGPLKEISANFSLQFSSLTQFAKISNKKVIAENQCEKHKKSSLAPRMLGNFPCFCCRLLTFFQNQHFRNTIVGPTCLQRFSSPSFQMKPVILSPECQMVWIQIYCS